MSGSVVYCVDSSALIDLRVDYPRGTFPSLWQDLTSLVSSERLIAPREVWREIKKDNVLPSWVKSGRNKLMFVRMNPHGILIAQDIIKLFPSLFDPDKETPDADPFVIALAESRNLPEHQGLFGGRHIVVTKEKSRPQGNPRIPDVCAKRRIECLSGTTALTELFGREGWSY